MRAYGGPQLQVTQQVMGRFAEAIEQAKVDVVPRVLVSGGASGGSSSILETLLAMLMSDKLGDESHTGVVVPRAEELEAFRSKIKGGLLAQLAAGKT